MDQIQIILLQPSEWEKYKSLRLEALNNDSQAFGVSLHDFVNKPNSYWQDRLKQAQQGKVSWLLFAKSENNFVGMVGAFIVDQNIPEIVSLYVQKSSRGKGIAKQLMDEIIKSIQYNFKYKKVRITVNINQTEALKLYKKLGFKITEEKEAILGDGQKHHEYVMEKSLK